MSASRFEDLISTEAGRRQLINGFIQTGMLDNSFNDIWKSINARRETLAADKYVSLSEGDRVMIQGAKPAYLNGVIGTVCGKDSKYIWITVDAGYRSRCGKYLRRDGTAHMSPGICKALTPSVIDGVVR